MKLNVGCGRMHVDGYLGVDVRPLNGVHYVVDALRLDMHVPEKSVDAIYSRHFLEHLTQAEGRVLFQIFNKIMKPGASLEIIVPNLIYHAQQLADFEHDFPSQVSPHLTNFEHGLAGFYGWQRNDETDVHKFGYTITTLPALFVETGFNVDDAEIPQPWNLRVLGHKPA